MRASHSRSSCGLLLAAFSLTLGCTLDFVLTGGGIVAFFLGALMLFNRGDPAFRLSLGYIIPAVALTAATAKTTRAVFMFTPGGNGR